MTQSVACSRAAHSVAVTCIVLLGAGPLIAEERRSTVEPTTPPSRKELEAALMDMLSGATLEGAFTNTAPGRDPTQLSPEKYTLGQVRKLDGNLWLIPARIQYGEHDVTLPITVPIEWAGDTPVVVVDDLGLPQFGTVSARVIFFSDHYAGWWKHGESGGHLFGTIHRAEPPVEETDTEAN